MVQPAPTELTTWKEVAAYLGVSVRTAQNWERDRGLPVRRIQGERGRIWVRTVDLDAWKEAPPPEIKAAPGRKWPTLLAVAVIAAAACGVALIVLWPGAPASFRVQGAILTVIDARERVLWRKQFEFPLDTEGAYRDNQGIWFGDLDGDGRIEVLFAPAAGRLARGHIPLYCFSDRGQEKWRKVPDRPLATRREQFHPTYAVKRFVVAPIGPGGAVAIVTASVQYPYYPSQVAILSPRGEWLAEYWHSGHLNRLLAADVNGDGRPEIVAGGISNAYQTATLLVLDPAGFGGASVEENLDYQLLDLPPAREKARILFARSCVNRAADPFNQVALLELQHGNLVVNVAESADPPRASILYEFDPGLKLKSVSDTSQFRFAHDKLQQARAVDHPYTADLEELRRGLRRR